MIYISLFLSTLCIWVRFYCCFRLYLCGCFWPNEFLRFFGIFFLLPSLIFNLCSSVMLCVFCALASKRNEASWTTDMWSEDAFIVLVNQWKSSFDYFLVTGPVSCTYMILVISSIVVNCNTQRLISKVEQRKGIAKHYTENRKNRNKLMDESERKKERMMMHLLYGSFPIHRNWTRI